MPKLERDELEEVKAKIERLNLQGAKQVLLGMAEIMVNKPSVIAHLFRLILDDGVKITVSTDGQKNGGKE